MGFECGSLGGNQAVDLLVTGPDKIHGDRQVRDDLIDQQQNAN